jgi:hypothetical protein
MGNIFWMNKEIAHGMVRFFSSKKALLLNLSIIFDLFFGHSRLFSVIFACFSGHFWLVFRSFSTLCDLNLAFLLSREGHWFEGSTTKTVTRLFLLRQGWQSFHVRWTICTYKKTYSSVSHFLFNFLTYKKLKLLWASF